MTTSSDWYFERSLPDLNEEEAAQIRDFQCLYYDRWRKGGGTYDVSWLGHQTVKTPNDLIIYQEIISQLRPDVIIETGTRWGGSALFLASICDLIGNGQVVTVDVEDSVKRPEHPRVSYILGSSIDPKVFEIARSYAASGKSVMAILDSDHSATHVAVELSMYADLVSIGQYLIVEDTNINGHPVRPEFGPGPWEAVEEFLEVDTRYVRDEQRERFLITASPGGFLKRVV
ncbi:CmcI family methyltransferase [Sphingobium sp. B2]|uniref:CmcI family methyltransferase n=1 Tax=Sphingobium sp. B2 TaxID=2583228 RepID=UPI0011A5DC7D|nr:CmcI family methyltransferase [Sphingobium sp. B2]